MEGEKGKEKGGIGESGKGRKWETVKGEKKKNEGEMGKGERER